MENFQFFGFKVHSEDFLNRKLLLQLWLENNKRQCDVLILSLFLFIINSSWWYFNLDGEQKKLKFKIQNLNFKIQTL